MSVLVDYEDNSDFSMDDIVLSEKNKEYILQKMIVVTMGVLFYLKEEINVMEQTINLIITLTKEKKTKIKVYVVYVKRRFVMIVTQYYRRKSTECL